MLVQVGILVWLKLPLFTSDSGAYLLNSYAQNLPMDRPVFYSWFIVLFKNYGLRYLGLFQSLVLAAAFANVLHHLGVLKNWTAVFVAAVAYVFSGLPVLALQLMPDAFTAVLFLTMYLMLASKGFLSIVYSLLLAIICTFHFSHVAIVLVCITGYVFISKQFQKMAYLGVPLLAMGIMSWVNYQGGLGFKPSPASHVYFMGKMVENGIAKRYLNDNCTTNKYALCAYKDQLQGHAWDFVWNANGAFAATGGWQYSAGEYKEIIKQTVVQPKYLVMHIQAAALATINQVCRSQLGDGMVTMDLKSNVFEHLANAIPRDMYLFTQSKQNSPIGLPWQQINYFTMMATIIGVLCLILLVLKGKLHGPAASFVILLCVFVLSNAFVTGALANILSRLNSRALLLLPAVIIPQVYSVFFNRQE